MVIFFVDPIYYIICAYVKLEGAENVDMIKIGEYESHVTGKPCKFIAVEENQVPFDLKNIHEADKYLLYPTKRFYKRPYFSFTFFDENSEKVEQDIFEIEKTYTLKVKLENPDNIYWGENIKEVKIKDRAGLLKDFVKSKIFALDKKTKECYLTIRTRFPGIFVLRAKDVNYLTQVSVFTGRFVG